MKKQTIALVFSISLLLITNAAIAQRYATKSGHISFFSETPLEKIEAHNKQVNSALDMTTGDFVFRALMKSFAFEKALMQEHFNENYVESDKFPNASFKGKIVNIGELKKDHRGTFQAVVEGELTIHGVTRKIKENGTLTWSGDALKGEAVFFVKPADYEIKIPGAVVKNIAESIQVKVKVDLQPVS